MNNITRRLVAKNQLTTTGRSLSRALLIGNRNVNRPLFQLAPFTPQTRLYQSDKSWENPSEVGYFDTLGGVYEDPNYRYDLRPFEWREGQWAHYVSEIGTWLLLIPPALALLVCSSMLVWYTLYDLDTSVDRSNPLPYLLVRNGQDLHARRNPVLMWAYPLGYHQDRKVHFMGEIKDAIERKKTGNW